VSLAFLLTTLVVVATPGTGAVFTIGTGIARGRRASLVAAIGCTLGIVPHLVAALTGLAALLHASAMAFQALKYAGVAYLLFLAVVTLRDRSDAGMPAAATTSTGRERHRGHRRQRRHGAVDLVDRAAGGAHQPAQPEADDLLRGVPAPVRPR